MAYTLPYGYGQLNRFARYLHVESDAFGIDPLLDKLADKLSQVTEFTYHEVKQEERGAADLISLREYGTEDHWIIIWIINAIASPREIAEGMQLKIIPLGTIIDIYNQLQATPSFQFAGQSQTTRI